MTARAQPRTGPDSRLFKSVIFDFDYTLVDSSTGVIECVNYALGRMGLPSGRPGAIRGMIGVSLSGMFDRLAGQEHGDRFDEFKRLFTARGDQVMLQGTRLFDSVRPVVEALLAAGISLGIVSTKFRYRIEEILERDGLRDAFAVIVGGEDVAVHKPDPTGLEAAIGVLGRSPAEVLYVGDTTVDAETSTRAGVLFAAVLSGVTPREALAGCQPWAILEDLTALPALVLERRGEQDPPR
jgi:phosphoglycolate phosphatase